MFTRCRHMKRKRHKILGAVKQVTLFAIVINNLTDKAEELVQVFTDLLQKYIFVNTI